MDPRLEANRSNWNERVEIHSHSRFYDVDAWLRDAPGPNPRESEALGNLDGKTLVHLQCHFGMDTMRFARAGAVVTGLDFSPAAIDEARDLSKRAGLADRSRFVCANVYDAPLALAGERFDVVYVSLGSLCWLPDIAAWGDVVSRMLNPSGQLYVHDVHPFSSCFDDNGERITYGYFEEADAPFVYESALTYTDSERELSATRTFEWNHSIGEIIEAIGARGLVFDSLGEHDWTQFQQFPWLVQNSSGEFVIPEGRSRIPLSFTLLAHSPSGATSLQE
jgi:SAM-dependent methyltransferase